MPMTRREYIARLPRLLSCLWYSVVVHLILLSALGNAKKQGILVIPGIGRIDRLQTTVSNLKMMAPYLTGGGFAGRESSWDCVAYVYALHNDTVFWNAKKELEILSKNCDVVENPGKRVTENLYMAQPALIRKSYEYVFILLDDCKLLGKESVFDLEYMIKIMRLNGLSVASPKVG
jgi:hypothetical protein